MPKRRNRGEQDYAYKSAREIQDGPRLPRKAQRMLDKYTSDPDNRATMRKRQEKALKRRKANA